MNELAPILVDPSKALTDTKTYPELYARMKAEVDAFVPDLSTEAGRKRIAALAYKVTRTKTAIDDAGKELNRELREKINLVDAERRKIREELDDLATKARAPLTAWEEAEAEREAIVINAIAELLNPKIPASSAAIQHEIDVVAALPFDPEIFRNELGAVEDAREKALVALKDKLALAKQSEADKAELDKLRAEKAERDRQDAEREAREKAEAARLAAEKAEAEHKAAAEAEAKRREEDAAARAREEEQRKAQAEIEAANRRAAEAEAAAKREREEREAAAKAEAEEQAKREADKKHRAKVLKEAAAGIGDVLDACSAEADNAVALAEAIVAGKIPHVSMRF